MSFDKNSWCILSPIEQSIKRKIEAVGVPLKDWNISINYGIKTGCNEAFIIDGATKDALIAQDPKSAEIIRPILRGRDIKRYSYDFADKWLITTFPSKHYNIDDYPAIKNYLLSFGKEKLEQSGKKDIGGIKGNNARKRTNNKWFETQDTIAYWDDFSKQKIVWARLMRISKSNLTDFPRFSLVKEEIYPIDSLCFFTGDNLEYLQSILNSEFATYWFFNNIAILDNGGMQMRQQYIEKFPIPEQRTSDEKIILDNDIYSRFGFSNEEINFIKECISLKVKDIMQ